MDWREKLDLRYLLFSASICAMRFAQISYHTCPLASEEGKETGGMNVYVYNLSLELAKLGHQVDVFTRSEDIHAKKIVQVAPNFRVIHLTAGPEKTLPKKELIKFIPEFSRNLSNYLLPNSKFLNLNSRFSYDIIHAHYYMSGMAILDLYKNMGQTKCPVPTIISFHTLALLKNLVARGNDEMESQTRIEAEMELVKKAYKIIAPSKVEFNYLKYLYATPEEKIEIIPPGFDATLFKPMDKHVARAHIGANPKHKIILFVGRIEPLKGIDVLMYALKILVARCPDCPICLWIVGGEKDTVLSSKHNPELQKLYQLRDTLKLHSVIKFVPQQHQHELPFYYNAADVVVMPSHYESFGMTALEATACGAAVVTTNVAGIAAMFENSDQHLVISANNPLMLAQAIEKIIHRRHIFWARRKKVQDLSWEKMAKRMEKVYAQLINTNS